MHTCSAEPVHHVELVESFGLRSPAGVPVRALAGWVDGGADQLVGGSFLINDRRGHSYFRGVVGLSF
jgi:hypothetical protein